MGNGYLNRSQEVTGEKVFFNKQRFDDEMQRMRQKKRRYSLKTLSDDVYMSYGYIRQIWKKGLSHESAKKIADVFGVYLDYLEGKSGIRTEKDLEELERESLERDKRAENRLFSCGLEFFQLLPNINIVFVENIDRDRVTDTENEPNIGYKITYRDKNYNESAPIYKTVSEMKDFLQNMNEIIEQIIILHASK